MITAANPTRQRINSPRPAMRLTPERAEYYTARFGLCVEAIDRDQVNEAELDAIVAQIKAEIRGHREPITDETSLAEIGLQVRTLNLLELHGYLRVGDCRDLTEAKIRSWSNAGKEVVKEIRGALEKIEAEVRGNRGE